ncbi:MAG: AAA family ATPase, partial [Gammaproteobacteria bacterium]|nr:AAA family ATPase [Gammaproteobacteria bacterium]
MYEEHFGLERSPFRAKAIGTDVFVGPQTASTMAGFRKALTAQDAVVTVSGPVGTGKTTLVERAVDAMGTKYKTIRVGRIAMNSSDVLEALLVVLGVQDRPAGTIQRFAALRKKLKELQDRDVRVFILVEDALRAGVDTLAELEALTTADAGESDGASIVLMGDERLGEFMQSPELGQLQQRIRQRHTIYPQRGAEMRAYLMHCFRQVGGDFEHIFDARSVALLKELSGGIPRIANNLVESSLAAAAAKELDRIPSTLIAEVASDEYGLSADNFDFALPVPEDPAPLDSAEADGEPTADKAQAQNADEAVESEPDAAATDTEAEATASVDDSRDSNHHTLPDLAILSPNYAELAMGDVEDSREAVDVNEAEAEAIAEVIPEPEPEIVAEDIPKPEPEVVDEVIPTLDQEVIAEIIAEHEPEAVAESIPEIEQEVIAEVIPELEPEVIAEVIPEPEPPQDKAEEVVPQLLPDPVEVVVADIDPITAPELEVTGDMACEFASVPEPDQAETPIPEPIAAIAPEPLAEDIPELVPELSPEPLAESIPDLLPESEPQAVADNIPELLPEPEPEPFADLIPELMPEPEPEPAAENNPELVADPDWEQEPTLAELKPDLEALEQAMAFAQGGSANKTAEAPVDGGS